MKKTFSDICLERASRATPGPWTIDFKEPDWYGVESDKEPTDWIVHADDSEINRPKKEDAEFIAHARTDVPELCNRLKKAIKGLIDADEVYTGLVYNKCGKSPFYKLAKELEEIPSRSGINEEKDAELTENITDGDEK